MSKTTTSLEQMRFLVTSLAAKLVVLDRLPVVVAEGEQLHSTELHVIEAIGKDRSRTVTGLCRLFGVTKGAVSQVVSRLARKGYVAKKRNAEFGKEILLRLTAKGQRAFAVHETFHLARDNQLTKLFGRYSEEERLLIQEFLELLDRNLGRYLPAVADLDEGSEP